MRYPMCTMGKQIKIQLFVAAALCMFCAPLVYAQEVLRSEILAKLNDAVFEVVVLKPDEGSLEYEKELPLERIPFAIRTDKYLPIGTAFLMDDGLFYSAAHVFNLTEESQYGDYYLRSYDGSVYKVNSVLSFATDRDFIVFSVDGYTKIGKGLSAKQDIDLNTQTFSVGNALGEGIIIRNGLLTSKTFEQENGAWKWLRFSAAASPGNSGGPLITPDGKVLGIITMKSANENLNYALPFEETKKVLSGTGSVHLTLHYVMPNILEEKFFYVYDYEQKLPKKLTDARRAIIEDYGTFTAHIIKDIQKKFDFAGETGFTKADGSLELMYTPWLPRFPLTIVRSDNKKWNSYMPNDISEYKLPQNGSVSYGHMLNVTMALIKKPDNVDYKELILSPKLYMDYLLSASRMYRTVGSERVAVTSYGKPARSHTHKDIYGRTWLVNYWSLPFADAEAVSFALPVPGGLYIMSKTDSTAAIRNGHNLDYAFMTDYVIPRYAASFKNWKEFLSLPQNVYEHDPLFASMKFDFGSNGTALKNGEYELNLPSKTFAADEDTTLRIFLGFYTKKEKPYFELRGFDMFTNSRSDDYKYISITKQLNPSEDAPQTMFDTWLQKITQSTPFNAQPYNQDQYTYYDEILFLNGMPAKEREHLPFVYHLSTELKQHNKFKEIEAFASAVKKALKMPKSSK